MRANISVGRRFDVDIARDKRAPFASLLWKHGNVTAPLDSVVIPEAGARTVRRMIPASPATPVRTYEVWLTGFGLIAADQLALFVDALDPRNRVDVGPRVDEL